MTTPPCRTGVGEVYEVVTRLGDTIVELELVDEVPFELDANALRAGPVRFRRGLATIEVSIVARPVRSLPRPPIEWRVVAAMAASVALHGVLLAVALHPGDAVTPLQAGGSPRHRLVANHTSGARAMRAPEVVTSVHDVDAQALAIRTVPAVRVSHVPRERPPDPPQVGQPDGNATHDTEAARRFDPCADGGCAIIPAGAYATVERGHNTGDDYTLAPREPHELALSVVTCDVGSGCATVSGDDQDDIRTAISQHLLDVDACFDAAPRGASALVHATTDSTGAIRAAARDDDALGGCIATALDRLALHGGRGDVTLAFTRDTLTAG